MFLVVLGVGWIPVCFVSYFIVGKGLHSYHDVAGVQKRFRNSVSSNNEIDVLSYNFVNF